VDERERQALLDYFTCAGWEAAEAFRQAFDDLRRELLGEED